MSSAHMDRAEYQSNEPESWLIGEGSALVSSLRRYGSLL